MKPIFTKRFSVIIGLGKLVVWEAQPVRHGRRVHEHNTNKAGWLIQAGVLQVLLSGKHLQTILHV